MFNSIRAIAFLAFITVNMASKSGMTPLPTILALENTRIYVGSSNSSNMMSYIETSVNKAFSFHIILRIPGIDLNDSHIRFLIYLDNV